MLVSIDFETFYGKGYTLRSPNLTTIEYIRDPQFLIHGVSLIIDGGDPVWIAGHDNVIQRLQTMPWHKITLNAHNAYFDAMILNWHVGVSPSYYFDTLSMARAILPQRTRLDLDHMMKIFKIGKKLDGLANTKDKRELTQEESDTLGVYAKNDVFGAHELLQLFLSDRFGFPNSELDQINRTIRMGVEPTLLLDIPRASAALAKEVTERDNLIIASGVSNEVLSSNQQFVAHLRSLGIEPPTKLNPKGAEAYATAKNDLEFQELQASHPELDTLWRAREAVKSTTTITRTRRYIKIAKSGPLPMPYKYWAGHTGRWGGHDKMNPQNLKRGSELRKSIIAPPGYVICVGDSSQIELRTNFWFCDHRTGLEAFARGDDIYKLAAVDYFHVPIEEITPYQRFFGKTQELGLSYQMGAPKYRRQLAIGMLGLDPIYLSEEEAYTAVHTYRFTHAPIKKMWEWLQTMIPFMYNSPTEPRDFKNCIKFYQNAVILPNGMTVNYPNLHPNEDGSWQQGMNGEFRSLYGGKLLENIIQALARIIVGDQLAKIDAHPLIRVVGMTHDEIISLVPEQHADEALEYKLSVMRERPTWAPDLPLDAEGGYDYCYSK